MIPGTFAIAIIFGIVLIVLALAVDDFDFMAFFGFLLLLSGIFGGMLYSGTMEANIQEEAQYDYLTSNINQTRLMTDDVYNEEIRDMYQKELKHNTSARISDRYAKHET